MSHAVTKWPLVPVITSGPILYPAGEGIFFFLNEEGPQIFFHPTVQEHSTFHDLVAKEAGEMNVGSFLTLLLKVYKDERQMNL